MMHKKRSFEWGWLVALWAATWLALVSAGAAELNWDYSKETARKVPEWLRDGVVYEIFPRNFSQEGNFNAITAKLHELKDLGVNVLWLMPIHPSGKR